MIPPLLAAAWQLAASASDRAEPDHGIKRSRFIQNVRQLSSCTVLTLTG
eukprot:COSAG01_NODE_41810_length_447_cov_0.589080_1_plen_48_part_01